MDSRRIAGLVLEEAGDVLGELADWARTAPYCPSCLALRGCSHEAGCPLGRVARLRCLLVSDDEKRRDEELVALRRERGLMVTSVEDGELPLATQAAPMASEGGAT